MKSEHLRIVYSIAREGVRDEWVPSLEEWPMVLELLNNQILIAERLGVTFWDSSQPEELKSVRVSSIGKEKLEEWKEEAWKTTFCGRVWSIASKFTLWVGILIGSLITAAGTKIIEKIVDMLFQQTK